MCVNEYVWSLVICVGFSDVKVCVSVCACVTASVSAFIFSNPFLSQMHEYNTNLYVTQHLHDQQTLAARLWHTALHYTNRGRA
jgi:hypothetical protein